MASASTEHNVSLTSSELAYLWSVYQMDSMALCVLKYFLDKVEDEEIRALLEFASSLSEKHVQAVADIFKSEDVPLPKGFDETDVNVKARRLFTDNFILFYLKNMAKVGLTNYATALSALARSDVYDFFQECLASTTELHTRSREILLSKGLFVRSPYISMPEMVNFVETQSYLTGWFFQRRPVNAMEIAHLFLNTQTNVIGETLMLGFSMVASKENVRKYFIRGKNISHKHIEVFSSLLKENELHAPMTWDTGVVETTDSPFSDKLMMYHTNILSAAGIGNYGMAVSGSSRRDLISHYTSLSTEVGKFVEDGINIMISYGWLEEPPQADDQAKLVRQ